MRITANNLLGNMSLIRSLNGHERKNMHMESYNKDSFIHSNLSVFQTYGRTQIRSSKCSDEVLDKINFKLDDILRQKRGREHSFIVNGKEYMHKDLPRIDSSKCMNIKAVNNKIVLNNGHYYNYKDRKGKEHIFACVNDRIEQPYSDQFAGRQDKNTYQIAKFWNMLSRDGTYMSLYYSKAEQQSLLNDAGISEGFFSVQIGSKKQEYFYSNGNAGVAVRKFEYDAVYDMFAKRGSALFNEYDIGSVFLIGGKEYILNENRKFDIPYGEDIFDVQFPKRAQ